MTEATISQTLPLFLSPDNAIRNAAEQTFVSARQDPTAFVAALQHLAVTLQQPELRQMAAVLLRRNLTSELWNSVERSVQSNIQSNLLAAISTEPMVQVKKAIAEAISKLASIICSSGQEVCSVFFVFVLTYLYRIVVGAAAGCFSAMPD
jgi:hypothetical protein